MYLTVHCSITYNNWDMENTQVSIDRWMVKADAVGMHNGILLSHKRNKIRSLVEMWVDRVHTLNQKEKSNASAYTPLNKRILRFTAYNEHNCAKLLQSCPTLCDPLDCSPPGSSVHGARILEWLPCLPSGALPDPGIKPKSLMSPALAGGFFTILVPPGKPPNEHI